jgi:ubiquinone/menaquinone biosynthesis C-methylase UbiE
VLDLARRAAALSPNAVLETAAGSGVVTRALAPKLAQEASYTVTDLNQPMLDYAASRQPPDVRIKWLQANALELPFENGVFDVVCCQFGAMFFPDRTAGYREARRVLKPGGHFLFSVWDRIEENVFADDVTNALAEIFPNDPPRFLARTPHGYHDTALIRNQLNEAGFADVKIDTKPSKAARPRLSFLPLHTVRGPHFATKSKLETRERWTMQPNIALHRPGSRRQYWKNRRSGRSSV